MINTHPPAIFAVFLPLLASLMLSGCGALQQVDQGLYSIAESVSELDRVTGRRSLSLASRQQQIKQGNQVVEQLLAQEQQQGRQINHQLDSVQYWRMVKIFDRIHRTSHLRDERWQPLLIDRDSFNAFTTGGSYIVVHLGLMQQLHNDDEVAAVLAHEVAHTVANHVFEGQSLAQATALSQSRSAGRDGYRAAFTQDNEREADRIGVLYSALSGFDPLAASRIWQRQFEAEGNRRAFFFHSHPVNSDRAQQNREAAAQVKSYYQPGKINPDYARLLEHNVLWQKRAGEPYRGDGSGLSALTSTLFDAYQQHQRAKLGEQQQLRQIELVRYVQSQLQILQDSQPASDRWHLQLVYSGQVPLRGLTLGGKIPQGQNKPPLRMVASVVQTLRSGTQFSVEFRHSALRQLSQPRESVELYLDDALPAN